LVPKTQSELQGYISIWCGLLIGLNFDALMRSVRILSLAPGCEAWLVNTHHPRILHVFDRAFNLINEERAILSVVTPGIGNGPLNLVVDHRVSFSETLTVESAISLRDTQLAVGNLTFSQEDAQHWLPVPDWEMLHGARMAIARQIFGMPLPRSQLPGIL